MLYLSNPMQKKTRFVKFRVTPDQYSKIISQSQARGYIELSDYLRFLALDKSVLIEHKIMENNRLLHKIKKILEETNQCS